MTTERMEEQIRRLVEMGDDPELAALRVRDRDLWISDPESCYAIPDGPEAVQMWGDAYVLMCELADAARAFEDRNPAIAQLAADVQARAWEAHGRARERAGLPREE